MRVLLLVVADHANITVDGKLNILGIFRVVNAPSFPARHPSMHLIVKLEGELGEYGLTRNLTAKLIDPDGKEIISLGGSFKVPVPEGGVRPEINAIFELRDTTFQQPGPHQFVVLVDKNHKSETTLHVNKIEAPATAQ